MSPPISERAEETGNTNNHGRRVRRRSLSAAAAEKPEGRKLSKVGQPKEKPKIDGRERFPRTFTRLKPKSGNKSVSKIEADGEEEVKSRRVRQKKTRLHDNAALPTEPRGKADAEDETIKDPGGTRPSQPPRDGLPSGADHPGENPQENRESSGNSPAKKKRTLIHDSVASVSLVLYGKEIDAAKPVETDRFGNHIYTSTFPDGSANDTRSEIYVTQDGEGFLRGNPGIVRDIYLGMSELSDATQSDLQTLDEVDLDDGRKIKVLKTDMETCQSDVYILEVGPEKYVIRTEKRDADHPQSYISEMQQNLEMEENLGKELRNVGLKPPTYLFATKQLSCTRFIDGDYPTRDYLTSKTKKINELVNSYLAEKRRQNPPNLWANIFSDPSRQNYIQEHDGSLTWFDRFMYISPE